MLTVIESPLFTRMWRDYWSEPERAEFVSFLAANPDAGDVIPTHILKQIAEEMGHAP